MSLRPHSKVHTYKSHRNKVAYSENNVMLKYHDDAFAPVVYHIRHIY